MRDRGGNVREGPDEDAQPPRSMRHVKQNTEDGHAGRQFVKSADNFGSMTVRRMLAEQKKLMEMKETSRRQVVAVEAGMRVAEDSGMMVDNDAGRCIVEEDEEQVRLRMEEERVQLQVQLKECESREAYWRQEAEEAKKSLRLIRKMVRERQGEDIDFEYALKMAREEAAKEIGELQRKYEEEISYLMKDRARIDSALKCIKEMTMHDVGDGVDANTVPSSPGTEILEVEVECLHDDGYQHGELEPPGGQGPQHAYYDEDTCDRIDERFNNGEDNSCHDDTPCVEGHDVSLVTSQNGSLVLAQESDLSPNSSMRYQSSGQDGEESQFRDDSACMEESAQEEGVVEYTQPLSVGLTRPDSHQVDPGCPIIDFRGDIPGVFTENTMQRVLDPPLVGSSRMWGGSNGLHLPRTRTTQYDFRPTRDYYRPKYSPTVTGRFWRLNTEGSPTSCLVDRGECPLSPRSTQEQLSREQSPLTPGIRTEDDLITKVIKALGSSSPVTANLLTQHMTDTWALRASFPSNGSHSAEAPVFMTSAPAAISRREIVRQSKFLRRAPISLENILQ